MRELGLADSNHAFLPSGSLLGDYQEHLIEVLESSDPERVPVTRNGARMTAFELAVLLAERGDEPLTLRYRYRDEIRDLQLPGPLDPLLREPAWLERKLLLFRRVPRDGAPCPCQW